MRLLALLGSASVCWAALAAPVAGQGTWVPPQPPCEINPGHFKVNGGVLYLKTAAEKPTQRESQLGKAKDVLTQAILQDKQDKNPAAWYYLGRYYVEMSDAAGADSAFDRAEALVPQCAQDIAGYRERLWASVFNAALEKWREGKEGTAVALLKQAHALVPSNPKSLFQLGALYANRDDVDSAVAYLRRAVAAAGTDTAFARERREALANVARLHVRRAQTDPALQQWHRTRFSRDSLARALANDSTVLARMVAAATSRRARGTRLAPADQQVFSRDSTARAQALALGRAARAGLVEKAAADGAALAAVYGPAIEASRTYFEAFPDALDAATNLAALYGQSGRPAEAVAVFDAFIERTHDPEALFEAARRLVGGNLLAAGARAYALGLERHPHHRDALLELTNTYVQLRDSARALPSAQRLVAVDPLNRTALRLLAAAWELRGRRDSTLKYLTLADSTLTVDLAVTVFAPDSAGATLAAVANNLRSPLSKAFRITFEFLDAQGAVQASEITEIPALAGGMNHQLEMRVSGTGIRAWRYRPS